VSLVAVLFTVPSLFLCVTARQKEVSPTHVYEVRPRKDRRGVDLISDALPFGRLWYGEPKAAANAIGYAQFYSRSHHAVIRVYDSTGKMNPTCSDQRFLHALRHTALCD
jgi:hypothetical protein